MVARTGGARSEAARAGGGEGEVGRGAVGPSPSPPSEFRSGEAIMGSAEDVDDRGRKGLGGHVAASTHLSVCFTSVRWVAGC